MRLIDANKLKEKLETMHDNSDDEFDKGYNLGILAAIDLLDRAPYYDERPTGKWIEEIVPVGFVGRGNGQYRCSNCQHGDIQAKTQEVPFCWYCGAKMDKKEADNEHL